MKKLISILLSAAILLSLCGCQEKAPEEGYTFTDDLGRSVTVASPKRVAALLGSFADLWLLSGGELCAAADDAFEDLQLPIGETAKNLGSTHSVSLDSLLASKPELVLASAKLSGHLEMKEALERLGIAVAYFDAPDFEGYLRVLGIFCDITDNPSAYKKHGKEQQAKIKDILKRNEGKAPQSALVLRASASSIRVKNSSSTLLGGMLEDFGCINVADNDASLLEKLNIESILLSDPDKLFFIQTGDDMAEVKKFAQEMMQENPLWRELSAYKQGEIYYMEKELYNLKPNARFTEAYEKLEGILYESR